MKNLSAGMRSCKFLQINGGGKIWVKWKSNLCKENHFQLFSRSLKLVWVKISQLNWWGHESRLVGIEFITLTSDVKVSLFSCICIRGRRYWGALYGFRIFLPKLVERGLGTPGGEPPASAVRGRHSRTQATEFRPACWLVACCVLQQENSTYPTPGY